MPFSATSDPALKKKTNNTPGQAARSNRVSASSISTCWSSVQANLEQLEEQLGPAHESAGRVRSPCGSVKASDPLETQAWPLITPRGWRCRGTSGTRLCLAHRQRPLWLSWQREFRKQGEKFDSRFPEGAFGVGSSNNILFDLLAEQIRPGWSDVRVGAWPRTGLPLARWLARVFRVCQCLNLVF